MNISLNWLKQYIHLDLEVNQISEYLTDIGLEVEGISEVESIKGGLKGIIIGEVLTCDKHPNADRLSKTTVNIGEKNTLNIVCGAPNIKAGQKVPVATVGTILYNGDQSFKIKKSKIRGEVSEGMICGEDELGLGDVTYGIMVLNDNVKVGTLASEYFKVENDTVLASPADETPVLPQDAQADELDIARGIEKINNSTNFQFNSITNKWAGLRSFVKDKTPVIGFDKKINSFYWLAGQGGYGIETAPILARIAANDILGKDLFYFKKKYDIDFNLINISRLN